MTQYSGWVEKEVGLFNSVPHSWGSWGAHSCILTFPHMRNMGQEGLFWHKALLFCGRGVAGKVKLFLLSCSVLPISDIFAPVVCLNFSAELLDFPKCSLVHGRFSKLVFFGGKIVENSYFVMMMTSSLHNLNATSGLLYIKK